jgi:hypothetical protein
MLINWQHEKVINALIIRGEVADNNFVTLFNPQSPACAKIRKVGDKKILEFGHIKLNPKQKLQYETKLKVDSSFLQRTKDGEDGWEYYTVTDWNMFASALNLNSEESIAAPPAITKNFPLTETKKNGCMGIFLILVTLGLVSGSLMASVF